MSVPSADSTPPSYNPATREQPRLAHKEAAPRSEPALHQTPAKRRLTLAVGELIHGSGFAAFAMIVTFMSKPADGLSVLTDANKGPGSQTFVSKEAWNEPSSLFSISALYCV